MRIFTGKQIKDWDVYTMEHEPIRPIDLMERAAHALTDAVTRRWDKYGNVIVVFAGPGNNGGDALAMARLLAEKGYAVEAYLFNPKGELTDECKRNMRKIQEQHKVKKFVEVTLNFEPPHLTENTIVIDGLFGCGMNKPLLGGYAAVVQYINASPAIVVSIDMPSGLRTEDNAETIRQNVVRATLTLTLQQKKLAMYMADNSQFCGEVEVVDIQLSEDFARRNHSQYVLLNEDDVRKLLLPRGDFAHKGSMGHGLLIAGSYGMAGAAAMAAKACMRSGAGKVTVHTPHCNNQILQTLVPEAIMQHDKDDTVFTESVDATDYEAVAVGPGLGRSEDTAIALMGQIRNTGCPMVVDADAINLLAGHRAWLNQLPKNLIFTPHPGEFDKLYGSPTEDCYDRLQKAIELSERLNAYIILKGHYSALCSPDGEVLLNPTGNSGMATAGSGDVLTGMILGLLARGYSHRSACILGMYLHGLAGDIAAEELGKESVMATDIINNIAKAYKRLA